MILFNYKNYKKLFEMSETLIQEIKFRIFTITVTGSALLCFTPASTNKSSTMP